MVAVHGWVDPQFDAVREAFAANFEQHGDVGAACSVYFGGRPVVDLWGGVADPATGRPWAEDTLQLVFSATKGVTAICIHLLVERGELELDRPISAYWPEFAAGGKGEIPLRWVLSHMAGLAMVEGTLTLEDVLAWHPVTRAIAAQEPNWPPGTAHGYHVRSFGWILGEVIRRVTGRTAGTFVAEELASPLGLDFYVGLPTSKFSRAAAIVPYGNSGPSLEELLGADSLTSRALSGPSGLFAYDEMWNRPEILAAEMPSSNGVGDARSLARLYAAVIGEVDGIRVVSPETVETARSVQAEGPDKVLMLPTCYGLGFMLPPMLIGCGKESFGHPGAGGSLAFADPEAKLGFGYVMNQMSFNMKGDPRAAGLVRAVYQSLR